MEHPPYPEAMRLAAEAAYQELANVLVTSRAAAGLPEVRWSGGDNLDMPLDVQAAIEYQVPVILSTRPTDSQGATLVTIGLLLEDENDTRWRGLPFYGLLRMVGKVPSILAVWAAYLGFDGCPVWLEARVFGTERRRYDSLQASGWAFGKEQDIRSHGLKAATGDQREKAVAGARLLEKHINRGGRPAKVSLEEKRAVLSAILRQAERDGIPRRQLGLADAADILDEWCAKPQPIKIRGRTVFLPPALADHALSEPDVNNRRVERLKQWLKDVFGHRNWTKAKTGP